jgi:hypothetical protein
LEGQRDIQRVQGPAQAPLRHEADADRDHLQHRDRHARPVGGVGLGIGYISPVSTLIKRFPDRPGMATGLAIMGFGG